MDDITQKNMERKFDIAYMIAREKMAFTKMKHRVSLGAGYKNDHACATFVKFIARELQEILSNALSSQKKLVYKLIQVWMLGI